MTCKSDNNNVVANPPATNRKRISKQRLAMCSQVAPCNRTQRRTVNFQLNTCRQCTSPHMDKVSQSHTYITSTTYCTSCQQWQFCSYWTFRQVRRKKGTSRPTCHTNQPMQEPGCHYISHAHPCHVRPHVKNICCNSKVPTSMKQFKNFVEL